jgi:hypothetical protein
VAEVSTADVRPTSDPVPRPWTQAWIDALPIAPAWVGCAFAAGHVLVSTLYFFAFVAPEVRPTWGTYLSQGDVLSTLVFALVIGYATAALAYARRGHEATLRDLRPALGCDDSEISALRREVIHFDMAALRRTGLIAGLGAVAITYFTTSVPQRLSPPAVLWILWQNALCFWLLGRTIAHDLRVSHAFSQAAERYAEIELFDLTPLTPLAGRGLQSALLIVLALSLLSLVLVGDDISPLAPGGLAGTVLLAAIALALPSLGGRRRVRSAKREELARLSGEIRAVRTQRAAMDGPEWPEIESRLATLLALKQHVEVTREWPFDLGTLGRFLLYSAIGVGSWLGGATVERVLDLILS